MKTFFKAALWTILLVGLVLNIFLLIENHRMIKKYHHNSHKTSVNVMLTLSNLYDDVNKISKDTRDNKSRINDLESSLFDLKLNYESNRDTRFLLETFKEDRDSQEFSDIWSNIACLQNEVVSIDSEVIGVKHELVFNKSIYRWKEYKK